MNTVISDFEKRVSEIEAYFKLLEAIEEKNARLLIETPRNKRVRSLDDELVKVLKANMFLLLYNLVESSIRQALAEIYDAISAEQLTYKDVRDEIKKIWITEKHKNFRNAGVETIFSAICALATDVIDVSFDPSSTTSGNIDGRRIREFAMVYGFSSKVHKNAKEGVKLFEVKHQRNKLAHGIVSFAECGRNYSVPDLRETKHQVVLYTRRILKNIDRYLKKKHYAASGAPFRGGSVMPA